MESNDITTLPVQKKLKPKIEDVIPYYLDGDMKQSAFTFIAYMRANQMQPAWQSTNTWMAKHKSQGICTIRLAKGSWCVTPRISRWNKLIESYDLYDKQITNDGLREIVWNNVNICRSCANCGPGWDMIFLGREFKNVCHNVPVWYHDPDGTEIDFIKKILTAMKQTISDNKIRK